MNLLWQQKLCNSQQLKIAIFTYRSPYFCFPWRCPCDYHTICCMDGKTIQCLSNPLQHVPIYLQQFPSYSNHKCKKSQFSRSPWGNHAKCCMDGKRIRCLQIVSQHVSIYLQQFPSYSKRKCKKSPFSRTAAHIFFPLETPLPLSCNMLHGSKDNSMLAKHLAACTIGTSCTCLSWIVSELYDA